LRAALDAEITAALRAPVITSLPPPPDVHLADALVSEYLFSRGLHSTLSTFCTEARVPLPADARAPGETLSVSGAKAASGASASARAGARMDEGASIDATARALSDRVAEPLLAGSLGRLLRVLPGADAGASSANERARECVRTWLRAAGARVDEPAGSLGREVVSEELGLERLTADLGFASERGGTPTLPLLLALVVDARTRKEEGSLAVPGWLAPGAREGLAAASAAIRMASRDERATAAADVQQFTLRAITAAPSEPAFDSDEDVPGVLARVGAAVTRTERATAAARNVAAKQLAAGSADARFAASSAGRSLFVDGDA
jgi:hypothetical protein